MSDELDELRKQIDSLDEELLRTLARRAEVVKTIGRYKKAHGLELRDDERLQALLAGQLSLAESLDLPKEFVAELYELIHSLSLKIEAET